MIETTAASPRQQTASDPAIEVFRNAVRGAFAFLKQTTRLDDAYAKSIPLAENSGYLLPVCELHDGDDATIAMLARWRKENEFAFPAQFPVTIEGTASWLRARVLDVEERMLFFVLDSLGRPVGHMGLANANDAGEIELDNIIKGEAGPRGIMTRAGSALMTWAEEVLGAEAVFLRAFEDSERAMRLYRRLDFVERMRTPMRARRSESVVSWEPSDPELPAERWLLRMDHQPERRFNGERMILTAGPSVSARETSYALDAARHGWNTQWGKYLSRFERTFAEYLGVKYAIATSSCTGALHIALTALGIGPGDEVIVPDLTWVATANAVQYTGATPRFADIDPETWCMDPASMEALIGERTKAIIPVHLYGHPARMDVIREIAARHNLELIEDAAPAVGAECNGRLAGTFGKFSAFSFQGAKVAVTGEGGMLVTDDEELYRRAYKIWDQGRVPGTFDIETRGLKYKMSNLQAAFGLGQIERIAELIEAKRRVFRRYAEGLAGVPHIRLMAEAPWARSIYWMTNLLVEDGAPFTRDELRAELKARNVDSRPVFPPVSSYPMFAGSGVNTPVTRRVGERGINLPSGVCLKREEIRYVCDVIREFAGRR